jgi:hypothetical protein
LFTNFLTLLVPLFSIWISRSSWYVHMMLFSVVKLFVPLNIASNDEKKSDFIFVLIFFRHYIDIFWFVYVEQIGKTCNYICGTSDVRMLIIRLVLLLVVGEKWWFGMSY